MADSRIPGLPTTTDPVSGFSFIMDKGGASAVCVPYNEVIIAEDSVKNELIVISGNISIATGNSEVGQYGKVVSGYARFTIDSALASSAIDLIQIPNDISPPSTTIFSLIANPSYQADPGSSFTSPKLLRINTEGIIQVYLGSGLQVGISYVIQFSYVV